jgi:hypothetical protein
MVHKRPAIDVHVGQRPVLQRAKPLSNVIPEQARDITPSCPQRPDHNALKLPADKNIAAHPAKETRIP